MAHRIIPFNRPTVTGLETARIEECIRSARLSGDGPFTQQCQAFLQQWVGSPCALLTPSCTSALELTALLLDIRPGDEVIVPAFTFVSSINAFVLRGARPVFVDVSPATLNLDTDQVERRITANTRAIVAVHYGGIACDMDSLASIGERHGVALIEDNAHGLFGSYRGRPLGSLGCLGTLSFHETKNLTCGEGGALLINDPALVARAEVIREKGTDRSRFLRGEVNRYSWIDLGSSYLPSELQAAFLSAQLQQHESIQAARKRIWERYRHELAEWAESHAVQLPHVPDRCTPAYHLFHLILPSSESRDRLARGLRDRGIAAVSHYPPLHLSEMGRRFGGIPGMCPFAEAAGERLLRLPFYTGMTEDEQGYVLEHLRAVALS